MNKKYWLAALFVGSGMTLSGCGGGGSSSGGSTPPASVNGTAATGAPIVGGTVNAKCADANTYPSATTLGDGSYTLAGIPAAAFPCALEVSYGSPAQTLHSYATGNGTVNITPLTDLSLALATSANPATWFSAFDGTAITNLSAQNSLLLSALATKGFNLPSTSTDPFTTPFSANHTGWDKVLDDLQQAIADDGALADYAALVDLVKDGNLGNLPAAPEDTSDDTQLTTVHANLSGDYTLTFAGNCGSLCSYADGQTYSAAIDGNNLTIDSKSFHHPFNRKEGETFNLVEANWDDGQATHLRYALSNNQTGVFNEINLFDGSTFLGQFTEESTSGDSEAVTKFSSLSGSYAPTVTNFDDIYGMSGGTAVTVQVSDTGVVTLKDLSFDPADSSLTFQDRADNAGHFYELNGSSSRLRVFLDTNNEPVYLEVKQGSKYLELTAPMPADVTTFLDAIKAAGPQTLTVVADSSGAPCSTSELTVTGNSPNYSIQWDGGPLSYSIKTSIYEEGDDVASLIVSWGAFFRLTYNGGVLEVEALNKWPLNTAFTDPLTVTKRATTDATAIAGACPSP